jgi:hypothetical protein
MFAFYQDDIIKTLAIFAALSFLAGLYALSFLYGDWEDG